MLVLLVCLKEMVTVPMSNCHCTDNPNIYYPIKITSRFIQVCELAYRQHSTKSSLHHTIYKFNIRSVSKTVVLTLQK